MALTTPLTNVRWCKLHASCRRDSEVCTAGSLSWHSPSILSSSSSSFSYYPPVHCFTSAHNRCNFVWDICNWSGKKFIWKHKKFRIQAMAFGGGRVNSCKSVGIIQDDPDHLLVLVHGLVAGPSDWTFIEAELKKRLGNNFLIYVSSSNVYAKTLAGIDVAGKRLAAEVHEVVQKTRSLTRISFLAHSLGGLFTRYAIGVLYTPCSDECDDLSSVSTTSSDTTSPSRQGQIAGLEPISFITLASPHIGVRGRKQLPFLFGVPMLEKLALPLAPIIAGRSGNQLFLNDGKPDRPPLLLRMARDCAEAKFLYDEDFYSFKKPFFRILMLKLFCRSALAAFRFRVVYANVSYDHIVGWRTSSIRRESELVKPSLRSLEGYKHIVNVEHCLPISSQGAHFSSEAVKAKEAAQKAPTIQHTAEYHDIMEEEMIRGLQQLGWKKVDVSFHSAPLPFLAHNNIHVKNEFLNSAGVGVVTHVADCIREQECFVPIAASL